MQQNSILFLDFWNMRGKRNFISLFFSLLACIGFFLPWMNVSEIAVLYNGPQVIRLATEYDIPFARTFFSFPVIAVLIFLVHLFLPRFTRFTDLPFIILLSAMIAYYFTELGDLNQSFLSDIKIGYGLYMAAFSVVVLLLSWIFSLRRK